MKDEVFERRTFLWGYMHSVSMFANQAYEPCMMLGFICLLLTLVSGLAALIVQSLMLAVAVIMAGATAFCLLIGALLYFFGMVSVRCLYGFWPRYSRADAMQELNDEYWQSVNEICRAILRSKTKDPLVGAAAFVLLPDHYHIGSMLDHLAQQGVIERKIDLQGRQFRLLRRGGLMM